MRSSVSILGFKLLSPFLIIVLALSLAVAPSLAQEQTERTRVDVELFEWGIDMPDELTSGLTFFYVTNTGDELHNFRIQGEDVDRQFASPLLPGYTRLMVVNLQPGDYEITDPLDDNVEQGMQLDVTVAEGEVKEDPDAELTPEPGDEEKFEEVELPVTGDTATDPLDTFDIGLELVADGFTSPIMVTNAGDGSGRIFVVDQVGVVHIIDENGDLLDTPFIDLGDHIVELREGFDERGLLGLAFHPEFSENGRFFVYYSAPLAQEAPGDWNHTGHISEFTVMEDDENQADLESERVFMMIDQPQFNHNGGSILFGPDGYLYIALGDGGAANDVGLGHVSDWYKENDGGNAQNRDANLLGKILRIDVDNPEGGRLFSIPEDNPFVDDEDAKTAIYAYGLRNPYRMSFDRGGENQLFAADVGQNLFEEVNIIEAGGNYGWNVREGTHCFSTDTPNNPPADCPDTDGYGNALIDPVIEYLHANVKEGVGISITGGHIYRGEAMPDLEGNYIFGDWSRSFQEPSGRLLMAEPQDTGLWPITELTVTNLDFNYFVMGFGEDEDGELYVAVDDDTGPVGTGRVYRLVAAEDAADLNGVTDEVNDVETPTPTPDADVTPTPTPEVEETPEATPEPETDVEDETALIQQGQQVFSNQCTACHGAQGQAGVGPALADNQFVTQADPEPVIDIVVHGQGQMPGFGDVLSDEQIAAVVSYIRNSFGNDASVVSPEEVAEVN
jgi:glucose/arabinose dehydrogenase/mono/diheme cytochrome c family protein